MFRLGNILVNAVRKDVKLQLYNTLRFHQRPEAEGEYFVCHIKKTHAMAKCQYQVPNDMHLKSVVQPFFESLLSKVYRRDMAAVAHAHEHCYHLTVL